MGADKFHEGDLPTEIESDHEAIITSCSLESDALAVEDFGLRSSLLDIIRRCPMRGLCQLRVRAKRSKSGAETRFTEFGSCECRSGAERTTSLPNSKN